MTPQGSGADQKDNMTTSTAAPTVRDTFGLISIILAILGFALAVVPLLGVVGWPLLVAALVLAIIGLTRKGQRKGTSIAGLALSVVAMIAAPVIALSLFVGSVNESAEAVDDPAVEVGTRENPAPLGSEVVSDEWTVVVNSVQFDAGSDPAFQEANAYIDLSDLPADQQFVLLNVTYTYTGDDTEGSMPAFVRTDIVTADGVTQPFDVIALAPGNADLTATLYSGGTITGALVRTIPTASIEGAVIAVTPGMLTDTVFVSAK
jgi:hypothetical protein